ncbi:hypothetical protein BCR34DRAFT_609224 [Clohesyomyces aquaticus]|uniref:Uncharacterized protein n=1 Tax=Clohesyomyces aquaticus TaxID=1231657 RepID=A0A1Y1XUY1_9PLEO|nr:hypothetical protein BCR34DRAFT_609224 [Clohesyomyces aquaticus]
MMSPLYLLGPPLLLLAAVPLAVLAVLTTSIAVSTLAVRVSIVYFELGVALMHSYLFPAPSRTPATRPRNPPSPLRASPQRARRRGSIASTASSCDTAVPQAYPPRLHHKSNSLVSLIGTSEPTRDFEGVGGWRVSGGDDEEALWMGINSRLELPAMIQKRKHQRSLTAGSQRWSWSPEAMRMSPMQSRARTPVPGDERQTVDEYFPPQPGVRPFSTVSDPTRYDGRRKSASGSSSSSAVSCMKQAGV